MDSPVSFIMPFGEPVSLAVSMTVAHDDGITLAQLPNRSYGVASLGLPNGTQGQHSRFIIACFQQNLIVSQVEVRMQQSNPQSVRFTVFLQNFIYFMQAVRVGIV
jgi:hypothetical protein